MSENFIDTEVGLTLVWMRLQLITWDLESSETSHIYYLYPETDILNNRNRQLITDLFLHAFISKDPQTFIQSNKVPVLPDGVDQADVMIWWGSPVQTCKEKGNVY